MLKNAIFDGIFLDYFWAEYNIHMKQNIFHGLWPKCFGVLDLS